MSATAAFLHLLKPGQEQTLEQKDRLILNCAVEARITQNQWFEMLEKTGAEKIEDILLLDAADFYNCNFKAVLQIRLDVFQSILFREYWSKLPKRQAEGTTPASLPLGSEGAPVLQDGVHQMAEATPSPVSQSVADPAPSRDVVPQMAELPPPPVSQVVSRLPMSGLCQKHQPTKRRKSRPNRLERQHK